MWEHGCQQEIPGKASAVSINIGAGSVMGLVLGMWRPGGYIMSKKSKSMVFKNKAMPPVQ